MMDMQKETGSISKHEIHNGYSWGCLGYWSLSFMSARECIMDKGAVRSESLVGCGSRIKQRV